MDLHTLFEETGGCADVVAHCEVELQTSEIMTPFRRKIRRNWRTAIAVFAMTLDGLTIAGSFFLAAHFSRPQLALDQIFAANYRLLVLSEFVFLGFFTAMGSYRTLAQSSFARQTFRAGRAYVYSIATLLSVLFLLQNIFYTRHFVVLFFVFFPVAYAIVWSIVRLWMDSVQEKGYGRWNTLAIGADPHLGQLIKRINGHPELGFDIVDTIRSPKEAYGDGMLHVERKQVEQVAREKRVGLIVFSSSDLNGSFDELEGFCRKNRIAMRVVSPESDYLFSKARLHDIAGIPLFTPENRKIQAVKKFIKRAFDLAGATVGLLLLSPLFLVVAVATKLESRGPVFFKQQRALSDRARTFWFYKFRSMHHLADERKDSLIKENETNGALFKIKNDPRLTRVGKFIRKYSIDELPQLINVFRGEMSLVGPRPLPVEDFARIQREDHMGGYFRGRSKAKPGMTGLWQISGRSDLGFKEMVLLDLYYIENQSLLFDIEILAQTIPVVLFGKGAY